MSLIHCPDCNKEISDRAPACPNCGAPNPTQPAQPTSPPPPVAYMRENQKTGEMCPFCKSPVVQGATVCGKCGATKIKVVPAMGKLLIVFGGLGIMAVGIIIAVENDDSPLVLAGVGGFIGSIVFGFIMSNILRNKSVWTRRIG